MQPYTTYICSSCTWLLVQLYLDYSKHPWFTFSSRASYSSKLSINRDSPSSQWYGASLSISLGGFRFVILTPFIWRIISVHMSCLILWLIWCFSNVIAYLMTLLTHNVLFLNSCPKSKIRVRWMQHNWFLLTLPQVCVKLWSVVRRKEPPRGYLLFP